MTVEASTRPTARTSTGTDSCVTGATLTGVGGGGPADCTFCDLHALIKTDSAITPKAENRITRVVSNYIALIRRTPVTEAGTAGCDWRGNGAWRCPAVERTQFRSFGFGLLGLRGGATGRPAAGPKP